MVFTSFGIYPEVELNHKVILFLIFWGTTILFATVLHHFAFPPTTYESSNFPISLPTFTISSLFGDFFVFDSSHLNGCEMLPHCGFDLHFLNDYYIHLVLSRVRLFVIPWTTAHQAPLSMGFPGQDYWSGCHFLLQGTFLTRDCISISYTAGGFFTTWAILSKFSCAQ